MAGRGPAPKETRSRERDQRRRDEQLTVVQPDGKMHGPELPEALAWPDATVQWWLTWRQSAQAQKFTDTDWSFLLDTAVLHAEFWLGDRSVAAELRLRAAKFGATPEDRARLKLEVGTPAHVPAARPPARARRERLLRAVGASEET
jgi:hypothetical protein